MPTSTMLGVSKLHILLCHQQLVELEMLCMHEINHECSAGTLAGSQSMVWIHRWCALAKLVS